MNDISAYDLAHTIHNQGNELCSVITKTLGAAADNGDLMLRTAIKNCCHPASKGGTTIKDGYIADRGFSITANGSTIKVPAESHLRIRRGILEVLRMPSESHYSRSYVAVPLDAIRGCTMCFGDEEDLW